MTRIKLFGDALGPTEAGPRKSAAVPAARPVIAPIEVRKFCVNGDSPSAQYWNALHESTNQTMLYRTKTALEFTGALGTGAGINQSSSASDRPRWRGVFHTGMYHHSLLARVVMHPQSNGFDQPAAAKLEIYSDATESTLVATANFFYGASPTGTASRSGWNYLKVIDQFVTGLSANTTYFAKVSDVSYGLIQSISVADLASLSENFSGYLPQNLTQDSEVLDEYREQVATAQKNTWKYGAAKVLNWSVDAQASPRTNTSSTWTNIIDGSTTFSDATAPLYFNMTGKDRLSQTSGVPVTMWAYLNSTSAANGQIALYDSAGAAITGSQLSYAGAGSAPGWYSASFNLPATEARYHLMSRQTAPPATLSIYAASIFEYEA